MVMTTLVQQYATALEDFPTSLSLASYFLSNFSRNAYSKILILIGRRGAKRQILKIKILILQRRSMRPFFS